MTASHISFRPNRRIGRSFDRSCVLMVGVGLGCAIGYAFASQAASRPDVPAARPAAKTTAPGHPVRLAAKAPAKLPPAPVALPVCPSAPSPMLLHTLQSGGPVRIGVFGDSFGDGVWAALYHRFPKAANFEVLRYSKPSTGFTRIQQLDLEADATAKLADGPVDIAVINFGANDDQPLVDNGHGVRLMSEHWKEVYADRAERFVATLRAHGATVYWMGLPKMRAEAYDRDLVSLSDLISERMARLGVPYVPVRDLSVDEQGGYSDYLAGADGKPRLMRAGDGIHMTMGGYARLAEPLARRIESDLDRARALISAAPGEAAPPAVGCVPAPEPETAVASLAQ